MVTIQPLNQSLFDHRLLGTYGYVPVQWLYHRAFQESPLIHPIQNGRWFHPLYYEICEKVIRVVCAILIIPALIFAGLGLTYNFFASIIWPLPIEKKPDDIGTTSSLENAPHTFAPLEEDILHEFKQLHSDFEDLFNHLDRLKGESGLEMDRRFNSLVERFEPYKDHDQGKVYFNDLTEMKLQYEGLRRGRISLFYDPPRLHDQSTTIRINDKGNCLYEAVARALDLHNCRPSSSNDMDDSPLQYPIDPTTLRQEVVAWERENVERDSELRKRIMGSIATILFDVKAKIEEIEETNNLFEGLSQEAAQEEERYKQGIANNCAEIAQLKARCAPYQNSATRIPYYLEQAAKLGVWGTEAELYAIAQMYQIGIYVQAVKRTEIKEGEETIIMDEHLPEHDVTDLFPERPNQMKLKNINGVHYEPLITRG